MNMKTNLLKRGFTLIELLVVIAIIGILASVVLASLNTARDKGSDASIKASINNSRAQAELYYDDNSNSYDPDGTTNGGVCTETGGVVDLTAAADTTNGAKSVVCNAADQAYAISAQLVTERTASTPDYYCVDSTGSASISTTALGANTVCP